MCSIVFYKRVIVQSTVKSESWLFVWKAEPIDTTQNVNASMQMKTKKKNSDANITLIIVYENKLSWNLVFVPKNVASGNLKNIT